MPVTSQWSAALTIVVRAIVTTAGLIALLLMSWNIAALRGRVDTMHPPTTIAEDHMITYSHVLPGGGTITLTMTKPEGKSWEDFAVEAAAAWAAVKAANGI